MAEISFLSMQKHQHRKVIDWLIIHHQKDREGYNRQREDLSFDNVAFLYQHVAFISISLVFKLFWVSTSRSILRFFPSTWLAGDDGFFNFFPLYILSISPSAYTSILLDWLCRSNGTMEQRIINLPNFSVRFSMISPVWAVSIHLARCLLNRHMVCWATLLYTISTTGMRYGCLKRNNASLKRFT